MKVCIIGVYFGKLTSFFPLWLRSCACNPSVDFLLVTDQALSELPPNVHLLPMRLSEMKTLADETLGMETALTTPYKCCDFKPVYGVIFAKWLSGYDYWGCCDFDMIFGDLASFFERFHLENYDKFLPLGHLALYRNTPQCNARYRLIPKSGNSYLASFTNPNTTQFDELGGINAIYLENGFPFFRERIFADISKSVRRLMLVEDYPDAHEKNYRDQIFFWENGKVFRAFYEKNERKTEEFIYIHLKKRNLPAPDFDIEKTACYLITAEGFGPYNAEALTKAEIRRRNRSYGRLAERFERGVVYRVRKKLRRLKKK